MVLLWVCPVESCPVVSSGGLCTPLSLTAAGCGGVFRGGAQGARSLL